MQQARGNASTVNIIMVGPYPTDAQHIAGGVEASVYGLAQALVDREDVSDVNVFSLPIKGVDRRRVERPSQSDRLRVQYLDFPWKMQASTALHAPTILRCARASKGAVTHIHGSGLLQTILLVALRAMRCPAVWTMHGITSIETKSLLLQHPSFRRLATWLMYSALEAIARIACSHIIVDTPYVAGKLQHRRGIAVIPQGVDEDVFADNAIAGPSSSEIISIGVIKPRKGHHLLLESFATAFANDQRIKLTIIGASSDKRYAGILDETIATLGLEDRVHIHTDLSREEMLQALRAASIFALHTQEESQCIAACEAMAAGRPVVSTAVGGLPYVVPSDSGRLVSYGDVEGFAGALRELMLNPDERAQLGARGRQAAQAYRWNNIAARVVSCYTSARTS